MKLCPKCGKQFSNDANFCPVDAARLTPLAPAPGAAGGAGSDTLSARFDVGERLGGSRTGAVHKAIDKQTKHACIVKLVAPAVMALPGVSQRLERELKQLERVSSAGVAKVLGSGYRPSGAANETWVAMEVLDGAQTLAEAISARGPIPVDEAAHLIEVIGEALIEAAQVGVVHRDLAPKNVLFAGSEVKLINFSLPVPTTEKVPGVPEFVAPEQVDGKPVDQRSNLYSLGALYYYVLSGQTVHGGAPEEVLKAHQNGGIKPITQVADVPAAVETIIMRALDRSPTKRFLTVRQFVDEVGRVAGGGESVRSTMPLGKANTPRVKGDLVQTLLGVKSGATAIPAAAMVVPQSAGAGTIVGVAGATGKSPWSPPEKAKMPESPLPAIAAVPMLAPSKTEPPVQQPAAPIVPAAPVVPAAKGDKKKQPQKDDKASKGKFRETMWFKKGELDAAAAEKAAKEKDGEQTADSLPMDERYTDDGSITRGDKEKYSLRTGGTSMMSSVKNASGSSSRVSEDSLIDEMKGGRNIVFIGIAVAVVVIVLIIILVSR